MSRNHLLFDELRYGLKIQVALVGAVPVQVRRASLVGQLGGSACARGARWVIAWSLVTGEHMARLSDECLPLAHAACMAPRHQTGIHVGHFLLNHGPHQGGCHVVAHLTRCNLSFKFANRCEGSKLTERGGPPILARFAAAASRVRTDGSPPPGPDVEATRGACSSSISHVLLLT